MCFIRNVLFEKLAAARKTKAEVNRRENRKIHSQFVCFRKPVVRNKRENEKKNTHTYYLPGKKTVALNNREKSTGEKKNKAASAVLT